MAANDDLKLRYTNMCGGSSSVTDFSSQANMVQAAVQVIVTRDGPGWPGMAGAMFSKQMLLKFCMLNAPKTGRHNIDNIDTTLT